MTTGLVSVVIPVFNRASMLREAVASALAQTWRPIEIIIVDDGSTDDTLMAAQALRASHSETIRVLSRQNEGPGAARQAGLEAARGEFIQFLDSDDLLLPDKFSLQVAALRNDGEAGISYGKTYTNDHGVRAPTPAQRSDEQHRSIFPTLLNGRLWETSTPLYRRSAFDRIGPWPRKRQMEDWEFDAQAGAAGIKLHFCDSYLAEYRIHGEARLAHAWQVDERAMRDRLSAYHEIHRCAELAGVNPQGPEMQNFARTLFWLARTVGSRGYTTEAERLLILASSISAHKLGRRLELYIFRQLKGLFGWVIVGKLSEHVEKMRRL
jgi:glycosyltransferase involved in cell wall biosynthesis